MAENLVVVKTCSSALEAEFIKNFLENNGIRATSSAPQLRSWTGRYTAIARSAKVLVLPRDAARARALLEHPPTMELPEDAEVETEELQPEYNDDGDLLRCPNCGSERIEEITSSPIMRLVMTIILLGLPLIFGWGSRRTWVCRDCDWDSNRR
ncbi:MAG TPA: hypothetical protein PLI09_08755 [Candidatus Hydrogenedentes bacterium]|nr:hypothetical protein [Candidatus Hydrogenedentota bacterium]